MKKKKTPAYIGCSGFHYNHWKDGVFYPAGLSQKRWLEYYAERFNTVELNVTFYRLPETSTFRDWAAGTPPGFKFAVKGSKLITHIKELADVEELTTQFLETAVELGDKLGPVLWQTPPKLKADRRKLRAFIKSLSRFPGVLHAFEFRHPSWLVEPVYKIISEQGMSVVSADYSQDLAEAPLDFPFTYIRRHGRGGLAPGGNYTDEALAALAAAVKKSPRKKRDAYVYFNNDLLGRAPANALTLIEKI